MKPGIIVLLVAGAGLLGFGWWGMSTARGRSAFDEMAGMIPLAAGALGVILLMAGALWALLGRTR